MWKSGGGTTEIEKRFKTLCYSFCFLSSNVRHNTIHSNQAVNLFLFKSRMMEHQCYCTYNICNISKTSLLCSVHWVSQDVTAGCGDHCALQWHSVHSHQQHCSLQRPVTILPLTTCSGGEIKQLWQHLPTSGASAATQSLFLWVTRWWLVIFLMAGCKMLAGCWRLDLLLLHVADRKCSESPKWRWFTWK